MNVTLWVLISFLGKGLEREGGWAKLKVIAVMLIIVFRGWDIILFLFLHDSKQSLSRVRNKISDKKKYKIGYCFVTLLLLCEEEFNQTKK